MTKQTRRTLILILALFAICCSFMPPAFSAEVREPITLVIIHTNDMHGRIKPQLNKKLDAELPVGGMAYVASVIKEIKNRYPGKTILLDCGDIAQGTPVSNTFKGIPVIEIMNRLKYDAMTLGNHEFDWGMPALQKLIETADFPIVSANIVRSDRPNLLMEGLKPYIIREVNGVRVGIIGLTTTETPSTTSNKDLKHITFLDPEKVLRQYIPIMKNQGASIIIVVSHLGHDVDYKLAANIRGVDIIVGGHTHKIIAEKKPINGAYIGQADSYTQHVGKIILQLDPVTKRIISINEDRIIPVRTRETAPDPEIQKIVEKYSRMIDVKMSVRVAEATGDFTRSRIKGFADTSMGNLVTDAMRKKTGTDAALINNPGIRADIYQGPVTVENIHGALPFDNHIITIDVPGSTIRSLLEHGANTTGCNVSGITLTVDLTKPFGQRISDIKINGRPLSDSQFYSLTTVDFLYNGGDNYAFPGAKNYTEGPVIRDVLMEYVQNLKNVAPPATDRIVFIKP